MDIWPYANRVAKELPIAILVVPNVYNPVESETLLTPWAPLKSQGQICWFCAQRNLDRTRGHRLSADAQRLQEIREHCCLMLFLNTNHEVSPLKQTRGHQLSPWKSSLFCRQASHVQGPHAYVQEGTKIIVRRA